tara:strand:- start:1665 stop:3239 length:1575 start_codon:yes stop_codon:yes gene_type:complete
VASTPPKHDSNNSLPALLSVKGITKSFPGIKANNSVDFEIRAGEVHSLLGENGAGKTTLINILYGLYQPDEGEIKFKGKKIVLRSPKDAIKRGLGLVAQHFHLARRHTVVENIALGLPGTPMFFPTKILRGQLRQLGEHYGLKVDPNARIWQLSPGEQQRVEILKVLIQGAEILILDEPTSVLTPQESDALFGVLRKMTSEGKAVILISHKLDEVMRIADTVSVLRKGNLVGCFNSKDTSPAELAKLMIGRTIEPTTRTDIEPSKSSVLELKSVWVQNDRGTNALQNISFRLRRREILGVAGVAGNGQGELTEVLTGLRYPSRGQIIIDGEDSTLRGVRGLFEGGVAHIPEDRNRMGIVPSMSVAENLIMRQYRHKPFAKGPMIDQREVTKFAIESIDHYSIATASKDTPSRQLSGGNVQKIILARELSGNPKLLVASHPTYGLDVAAAALTHELLLSQRARGAGVLLVSEDLDELIKISDRILVLFEGTVMGSVDTQEVDSQTLGAMMAGVSFKDIQGPTTSA